MSKLKPDWQTCGECDGMGYNGTIYRNYDPGLLCEECEGKGKVDHNTLPRSTCRPADKQEVEHE